MQVELAKYKLGVKFCADIFLVVEHSPNIKASNIERTPIYQKFTIERHNCILLNCTCLLLFYFFPYLSEQISLSKQLQF